jgi:predicted N-acetyltransferase YhbS
MPKILTKKIHPSEFDTVANLLTEAFITNPAYSIIFTKENHRREGLLWLFKTDLHMLNQKQVLTHVIKELDTGKIIGTFTLIPPQGVKTGISFYLKAGIPRFIFRFGLKSLMRMLRLDSVNKNALKEAIGSSEYHYLSMVAISEDRRGKGIGSQAIRSAIQTLASSSPACGLLGLTTQLAENQRFYSRLGFITLSEGEIDFKGDRYYNYNMRLDFAAFGGESKDIFS